VGVIRYFLDFRSAGEDHKRDWRGGVRLTPGGVAAYQNELGPRSDFMKSRSVCGKRELLGTAIQSCTAITTEKQIGRNFGWHSLSVDGIGISWFNLSE